MRVATRGRGGVYLATDVATAKGYSNSAGVYLKCRVKLG